MPAAVWVPAAAGLIGTGVSAIQGSKARKSQERSTDQAIAFEREKESRRQYEYDQQQKAQQEQWEARERFLSPFRRAAAGVVGTYFGPSLFEGALGPAQTPDVMSSEMPAGPPPQARRSLADFARVAVNRPPSRLPTTPTMEPFDPRGWSDWRRYGV